MTHPMNDSHATDHEPVSIGGAYASHPGRTRVDVLRWFRSYPRWPAIWLLGLLGGAALGWFVHASLWAVAGLALLGNLLYWRKVRGHFQGGCANPSVVISEDPLRIAVSSDLSKGDGDFPVIKIIEKPLAGIAGQQPKVGLRLATVALYYDGVEDRPHWEDFDPRPLECATGDLSEIARVISSFDEEDWGELERHLAQVPQPYRTGLYRIGWQASSD